jgi:hypothetical protein
VAGGFVGHQEAGGHHQGPGQCRSLLLSQGGLLRDPIRKVGEAEAGQQPFHPWGQRLGAVRPKAQRKLHVLSHGQFVDQAQALRHDGEL